MEEKSAQEKVSEAYQSAKAKVEKFAADERVQTAKEKVRDAAEAAKTKFDELSQDERVKAAMTKASGFYSGICAWFVSNWHAGTKGKIISICAVAVLVFFMLRMLSCFSGGGVKLKKISNDISLILTTLADVEVEKGTGYEYSGLGFKVLQWLPKDHAAIVTLDWTGGMGFSEAAIKTTALVQGGGFLGGGLIINELKAKARPLYLKTNREYVDGEQLEKGIYVYDGIVTYPTRNGSVSVRGFVEADPSVYEEYCEDLKKRAKENEKKAEKAKKAKQEEILSDPGVDGYTIPLSDTVQIRSVCGLNFGEPPRKVQKNLGKMIRHTPWEDWRAERDGGDFLLKKKFRVFDRVQLFYSPRQSPYRVLNHIKLWGEIDVKEISDASCKQELRNILNLFLEKFKLKLPFDDGENKDSYQIHFEGGSLYMCYASGKFELDVDCGGGVYSAMEEFEKKTNKELDAKKGSLSISPKDGANDL